MKKLMCCFVSLFIVTGLLVMVEAEEPTTEKIFFDMPLVVTAARHEQTIEEASSVVDVITSEDIANSGAQTLADVLRMAAGIDVRTRYGNLETSQHIDIRGLGGSSEAHRVLLLFNGIPFNWVLQGNFKSDESIPLNMIKRIEIIRGPGSALYGANAFNGVINVITKDTNDVKNGRILAYGGNYKTQKYEGELAARSKFADLLVTGRHFTTDGARRVTDNDGKKADNVYARVAADGFDITAGLGNSHIQSPGWLANRSTRNFHQKRDRFVSAKYDYTINKKMKLIPQVTMRKNHADIFLNGNMLVADEHSLGGSIQCDYKLSARHTVISGVEYKNEAARQIGQLEQKNAYTYAGFLQDEFSATNKLSVTLGARLDHDKYYSSSLSPRSAVSYKVKENMVVKADYGLAYRAPTFYERYLVIPVGTVWLDGNPNLTPERTNSLNVQFLHQLKPNVRYTLTVFQNKIRDMIGYENRGTRPFFGRPVPVAFRVNKQKIQVKGAEAEVRYMIKNISAYANYSFQEPKDLNTGATLINAPENKANAGLTTSMCNYLKTSVTSHYVDIRKSETAVESGVYVTVPKYITTDLKVSVVKLYQGLELSFLVYNLFNEDYQETYDEPAPRRRYYGEAVFSF